LLPQAGSRAFIANGGDCRHFHLSDISSDVRSAK
jgi:hypothetical protein